MSAGYADENRTVLILDFRGPKNGSAPAAGVGRRGREDRTVHGNESSFWNGTWPQTVHHTELTGGPIKRRIGERGQDFVDHCLGGRRRVPMSVAAVRCAMSLSTLAGAGISQSGAVALGSIGPLPIR